MSPKKKRKGRPAPRHHICRGPGEPLSIASTRVIDRSEPVRLVVRDRDGSRQFLDGLPIVDYAISTHAHHLFDEFPVDLGRLRDLPRGHLAVRDGAGCPWRIEPFQEE